MGVSIRVSETVAEAALELGWCHVSTSAIQPRKQGSDSRRGCWGGQVSSGSGQKWTEFSPVLYRILSPKPEPNILCIGSLTKSYESILVSASNSYFPGEKKKSKGPNGEWMPGIPDFRNYPISQSRQNPRRPCRASENPGVSLVHNHTNSQIRNPTSSGWIWTGSAWECE